MTPTVCLERLSDDDLLARLHKLVDRDRRLTAELLAHLAEVEARGLHLREGCSSLFVYCRDVLHLSDDAAYKRIQAARAARRFPDLLQRIASGRVNLTVVSLLAPHLTEDNCNELLEAAGHQSKREVERLLAERFPRPDVPDSVRRLPGGQASLALVPAGAPGQLAPAQVAAAPTAPAHPEPLSAGRYKIQFTADQALCDKLAHAQALLRHQVPSGDLAEVVDRALTLLVADLERRKAAVTSRPRTGKPGQAAGSRHIPAAVRRAVWERDEKQCAYVSPTGHRCTERGLLEFHHVIPYAVGGPATVGGIELRCRSHNDYEAVEAFGPEVMERARTESAVGSALKNLGYSSAEARQALRECRGQVAVDASIEKLLRAALGALHPSRRTG